MKKLILTLFLLLIATLVGFCATTAHYDKYGHKTGYYKQNGSTTVEYDKYGHKLGSYKTDSSGKTIKYDKYGHKKAGINKMVPQQLLMTNTDTKLEHTKQIQTELQHSMISTGIKPVVIKQILRAEPLNTINTEEKLAVINSRI